MLRRSVNRDIIAFKKWYSVTNIITNNNTNIFSKHCNGYSVHNVTKKNQLDNNILFVYVARFNSTKSVSNNAKTVTNTPINNLIEEPKSTENIYLSNTASASPIVSLNSSNLPFSATKIGDISNNNTATTQEPVKQSMELNVTKEDEKEVTTTRGKKKKPNKESYIVLNTFSKKRSKKYRGSSRDELIENLNKVLIEDVDPLTFLENMKTRNSKDFNASPKVSVPNGEESVSANTKIGLDIDRSDIDEDFPNVNDFQRQQENGRKNKSNRTQNKISVDEILSSNGELLLNTVKTAKMMKNPTNFQVIETINSLKPIAPTNFTSNSTVKPLAVSSKRYKQLAEQLTWGFTSKQLRIYINSTVGYEISSRHLRTKKNHIVPYILETLWNCEIDPNMLESSDVLVETKIEDLKTEELYLLLLSKRGGYINKFTTLGAKLTVNMAERKITITASRNLANYIEVTIRKILNNVVCTEFPFTETVKAHGGRLKNMPLRDMLDLIQIEVGVYIDQRSEDKYVIYHLGEKNFEKFKKLLLWLIDHNPQYKEKTIDLSPIEYKNNSNLIQYPLTKTEALNWYQRQNVYYRYEVPISRKTTAEKRVDAICEKELDKTVDEICEFIYDSSTSQLDGVNSFISSNGSIKTTSITLGHILESSTSPEKLFFTKVPEITSKILKLPVLNDSMEESEELEHLSEQADDLEGINDNIQVDKHDYLVQLRYIPNFGSLNVADVTTNPSLKGKDLTKLIPPVELWFELDEHDRADVNSMRCVLPLSESTCKLKTTQLPHDYKVTCDNVIQLCEPFYEQNDTTTSKEKWLDDQPGLKEYGKLFNYQINKRGNNYIPKSLHLNIPLVDGGCISNLRFDKVEMKTSSILKFRFKDKYIAQYSFVDSGSEGGKTTRIDFINPEVGDGDIKRTLKFFLQDVMHF
ncbi:uncharacterized protein SCODWIG_01146 [Saccharomycodes ludwigii]|uniref:Uncharacterized protein n=1 Tax=Saccharomycodes ludwigii TaxID=36035 RepID=A0A376B3W5_9ASCO|nr:hypothetical protein SCDLUD_001789 [Saccharomycodes ludwigii]KAH3902001.1 hypothetical protein SCDLUD_001789 [Saccharomycodes ludwigii]SSD59385.1 uncharacterized protein SCODWIG_01146 [Saccharomycodes ludwigii]